MYKRSGEQMLYAMDRAKVNLMAERCMGQGDLAHKTFDALMTVNLAQRRKQIATDLSLVNTPSQVPGQPVSTPQQERHCRHHSGHLQPC